MGWLLFSLSLLGQPVSASVLGSELEPTFSTDRDDPVRTVLTDEQEIAVSSEQLALSDLSSQAPLPPDSPDLIETVVPGTDPDHEQRVEAETIAKRSPKPEEIDANTIAAEPLFDAAIARDAAAAGELAQAATASLPIDEAVTSTPALSLDGSEAKTAAEEAVPHTLELAELSPGERELVAPRETLNITMLLAHSDESPEGTAEKPSVAIAKGVEEATDDSRSPDIVTAISQFLVPPDEATDSSTEMSGMPESPVISQSEENAEPTESDPVYEPIDDFRPLLQFQAASIYQDDELSGRLRATALYALNDQVMFGATVDLVGGSAFVDSADEGLSLNELYVSAAPFRELPNLRFVGGLIDLTSYFDRNSFAKDVVTHFFNPVFQTNPALSAAGISSRPGVLVNWSATDQLDVKVAVYSSSRSLGDFALDAAAAEVGFRSGNLIIRGTVTTARDAGSETSFEELFQIRRDDGSFGVSDGDREVAYGLNVEYFIESINVGLFGRYGWYENQDVGRSGSTFSLGFNALDVFLEGDRLGLGYGQQLSNGDLRSGRTPDVWEIFYDASVYENVRAGISLQSREEFSDTFLGIRVRADW